MPAHPYRPVPANEPRQISYAVSVLTAINLFNYIDRYVLPALLPSIEHELHFGFARGGTLGSAFIWVYMATSPLFGRLGDRVSRRVLIAIGIACWSIASAASGMVHSFTALLCTRAGVGIGEAAYATIAPALISDYYPESRRGRVMAFFFAAIPVGSALGFLLGGFADKHLGWRSAFYVTGLPGLLFAVLALSMYDPPRGRFDEIDPDADRAPGLRDALAILGRSREYVWAVAGYTAMTFGIGGLSFWMPSYLSTVRGLSLLRANFLVGMLTVVGGLAGTLIGGALGERARGRVRGAYFFVCASSGLISGVLGVAMFAVASTTAMSVLLFAAVFFAFVPNGPVNTLIVNSVPPYVRATASAVAIFCIHFFGDAGSPTLIGAVADVTGLRSAVLLMPLSITLGGVLWWIGRLRART